MAIQELNQEQVRNWSLEEKDRWWLKNVYRGDTPQLTIRSALTGMILGGVLSLTNLYVGAKTGFSMGVGITSVVLAFALFALLLQSVAFSAMSFEGPVATAVAAAWSLVLVLAVSGIALRMQCASKERVESGLRLFMSPLSARVPQLAPQAGCQHSHRQSTESALPTAPGSRAACDTLSASPTRRTRRETTSPTGSGSSR